MQDYPKVSIVTPSYNQSEFLEETIMSVLEQNYPNLEYFIFDGGSNDGSADIIKKYQKHLTYWASEKDRGQSDAINKGFARATGKYINWLNSDDVFLEGALFKLVEFLEANSSIDLVYGNVVFINSRSQRLYSTYEVPYSQRITLYSLNYLPQPAALYRTSLTQCLGPLDENLHYCMDHELWLRMHSANGKIAHINDFVAGYRLHSRSKGIGYAKSKLREERLGLKLRYGRRFNSFLLERVRLFALNIYYRIYRKVWQFSLYGKVDLIPTALKLEYFRLRKKLT